MKTLYQKNCQLKRYLDYQNDIQKLEESEPLSLIIIKKPNGYEDVFVLNKNGKTIGEFFPDESHDLYNFVKYPENFFIKCNVRKFLEKENNQKSVVVDVSVEAKDEFDYSKFLENLEKINFDGEKYITNPNQKNYDGQFWMLINDKWQDIRNSNDVEITIDNVTYYLSGKEYELFVQNNGVLPDHLKGKINKIEPVPEKKKTGCLQVFAYILLAFMVVIIIMAFFGIVMSRQNM